MSVCWCWFFIYFWFSNQYHLIVFISYSTHFLVWTIGIYMDGKAKTWWKLFISSCTKWKACRCVFNYTACRHNNGFFKWILCSSVVTRFLCGFTQSNGIGYNNANDSSGSDMGSTRNLHSGLYSNFHLII